MKKLLTLIIVLVVCTGVVWLGASWLIGVKTEQLIRQQLAQPHHDRSDSNQALTLIDYQSTLFGAKAVTLMDVRDTPLSTWVDELQLVHEIKNGPVFWHGNFENLETGLSQWQTKVDLNFFEEPVREMIGTVFAGAEPLAMNTLVDFERMADYRLEISPIYSVTEDAQEFRLDGALVSGKFDVRNQVLDKLKLTTGLLAFVNDDASLSLPAFSIEKTSSAAQNDELRFNADQVSILINGEPEAIRFNLAGQSAHQYHDEDLQGHFNLTLDTFSGIQYPLQRLVVNSEYNGIDAEGLTHVNLLQTRLQDIQAQLGWNEEEIETPEARRKITQLEIELQEVAGRLLDTIFTQALRKDQSHFKTAITLDTKQGDIQNTVDLTYAGTEQRISLEALMYYGLEDWAKLFRGEIRVDAAQDAIPGDVQFLLQYPIEKQAIINSARRYAMDLRLVGGDVELNERVVAFSDLAAKFVPQAPGPGEVLGAEIPPEILAMIETKGLTPEVMQQLEENDNVSADALVVLRQYQEMSKQLK